MGGDGGVPVDQTGEHAAHGLNAQGQRSDIQQQDILHVAGEHAALNGSANGHALVGVDALEAFLAGDGLNGILHGGDTGGAANQQHLLNVGSAEAGVGHGLTDGLHGALHQIGGQLVELCPGEGHVQMLGAGGVGGDIGQVNVGGSHAGQLDLGLLGSFLQALHSDLVLRQIDALSLLEFGNQIVHDSLVEVVAAQMGVAGSGQNLDDAVADVQNGHIEGAAAKVINHDLLLGFLVEAVSLTGVLRCLTLCVGEVSGDGDDGFGDRLTQISLGVRLQLLQDHGTDLLRGVALAVDGDVIIFTHVTLDGRHGAVSVGHSLTLCHLTDHTLAGLGKCNNRGGSTVAFGVGDDNRLAAFQNSNTGIGSTKVDTDNLRHNVFLLIY